MNLRQALPPFLWAALIWWVALVAVSVFASPNPIVNLLWGSGVWIFANLGFLGTALLVEGMLQQRVGVAPAEETRVLLRIFLGLSLKLSCFALLGMVVWAGREKAMTGILMASATLVVVPIGGGLVWHRQNNKEIRN